MTGKTQGAPVLTLVRTDSGDQPEAPSSDAEIGTPSLPRIDVTDEDVPGVAALAWAALRAANRLPPQFVRVGNMACLRTETGLEAFTPATLTYWLARAAIFFKELKSGDRQVKPPRWLVADMLAEREPALPEEMGP
jgi:hypothetical protein